MIIALFIIMAAVVSLPIAAVVVVSMASHREDAAWSLGEPAQGVAQTAARRLLDFHSEDPALPLPKNYGQARPAAPALHSVGQGSAASRRARTVTSARNPAATPKTSIRTAA